MVVECSLRHLFRPVSKEIGLYQIDVHKGQGSDRSEITVNGQRPRGVDVGSCIYPGLKALLIRIQSCETTYLLPYASRFLFWIGMESRIGYSYTHELVTERHRKLSLVIRMLCSHQISLCIAASVFWIFSSAVGEAAPSFLAPSPHFRNRPIR